jgi:AcrR family transcriptional regulator
MGHREDLLAGAKRCLYERGYSRTTARDIVAASGTNLASIGYHFGSKDALMAAAMMEAFDEVGAEMQQLLALGPGEDPLESWLERVIESFVAHREWWAASFDVFVQSEHSPEVREALATGYEHARRELAGPMLGIDPGEVDDATARRVGSFLIALQAGLAAQWLLDPEHSPSAGDIVAALRAVVRG